MAPDVLGPDYDATTLPMRPDYEGEVVATLVTRRAARPTTRAVLYVHGWADYFFQTELADFYIDRGFDFYALDLRKYGRSLLPHQTPNFCLNLAEYFEDLDVATRIIREEHGHSTLLLNGHSTGGLIATLWAHARKDEDLVEALFLNSPWFDLNENFLLRTIGTRVIDRIAAVKPRWVLPSTLTDFYVRTIHRDHGGEWDFDLNWKPLENFPVYAGWLRAIRRGHAALHRGLDIHVPVLVMCSTHSVKPSEWGPHLTEADIILDADQIAKWAPQVGRKVTLVRIQGAIHDLVLSAPHVRREVYAELGRWIDSYLPATDGGRQDDALGAAPPPSESGQARP